ncbi:MAG: family 78 glycoside hydrolase catalytic domain [Anaerolineaceae bacterium]|nr:family 78 glycoside hydrolase catalytic domain [Anaerolineaceae bacterium]
MSKTTISHLTCEYKTNPLGIDVLQPRLSWQMQNERRGTRQTAYQIIVATSESSLHNGTTPIWDSGKIESDQSIHVPYNGPALSSGQRVYWKARVWDEHEKEVESSSAWWEMGLLERADWKAEWIGAPFMGGPRTTSPAPYLRSEFTLQKKIASARLYATAIGFYECHLNGARVGDALLTPGWTDYSRRIQYQVYNVTKLLQPGSNAFGAILGDGWGVGHIAWLGRQHYADQPQFLAQIVITYADGNEETIATDKHWKVTQGAILESDMLMGESYDARRELTGWSDPGYDDGSWWPVKVFTDNGAALVATNGPLVKRQETLRPVAVNGVPGGLKPRWIFDFGQNMVGWVRLCVRGEKGTAIIMRHAEVLNPDGTLYTTNLRTARSIDHYTLKGGGEEIWEPRFTFHGFRYVEVAGLPGIPTEDTLTGIVIHSEIPSIGSFECSDHLINQLQHNIVWGQKGNFVDVPTDCPQRDERLGWTGDAQVFIRTAAFNMDVAGFFTKWALDMQDAQYANGVYPSVAPNLPSWKIGEGGPAWADAGVICPWMIYQCYADKRLLEERYASMQHFIEFLSQTSQNGIRCYTEYTGWHGNGDWLALDGSDGREGGTSKEIIGTAFYAYSSGLLAKIARILNKVDDAIRYDALAAEASQAFINHYVHEDGTIEGGTQTSYVLALEFDLLPDKLRALAAAELVRNIQGRDDHLSTGFVGTPYINWVLSKNGHLDTAYALLKQTTWPSWLYSVTQGATTIWERWDGWTHDKGFQDPKMNSFNHYAYGAIGAWMYAVIGGIDLDPEQPAYKHIIMHPYPGGGLTNGTAKVYSMYGIIRSAWTQESDRFNWQVTVPVNSTATIHVPAQDVSQVTESGQYLESATGVTFLHMDDGFAVLSIVPGTYNFTSHLG